MSTTSTNTSTNQYNPTGMSAYNQMTPAMSNAVSGYISNPFGNPFFQQQSAMGTAQANQLGQTGMNNVLSNLQSSGFGGGTSSPFAQQMQQQQAMANTGLKAQLGFQQPMQNAFNAQQNAIQTAANYKPLQTGNTSVQSTGGLGTWLPQVASMGLGMLTGGLMGGGMGGGGGANAAISNSMMSSPFSQPGGGASGFLNSGMSQYNPMTGVGNLPMGGGGYGSGG